MKMHQSFGRHNYTLICIFVNRISVFLLNNLKYQSFLPNVFCCPVCAEQQASLITA